MGLGLGFKVVWGQGLEFSSFWDFRGGGGGMGWSFPEQGTVLVLGCRDIDGFQRYIYTSMDRQTGVRGLCKNGYTHIDRWIDKWSLG